MMHAGPASDKEGPSPAFPQARGGGDTVITRRNDRSLRGADGSWVKNGDRWQVLDVHPDGAILVEGHRDGRVSRSARIILPAGYVTEHVQLGYASTLHRAQGATVDTTHTVLNGTESRQTLDVALSRVRQSNHLYLGASARPLDAVGSNIQDTVVEPRQVLTEQPAYPHLRGQLALRWVDGTPPRQVLEEATWYRGAQSFSKADDPAAVLAWRIGESTPPSHRDAPLPWLPDVPSALRQDAGTWDYLDRLTHRINDLRQRVADEAQQSSASDRVPRQRTLPPDVHGQLIGDLAVWRAAHAVPFTEPSPTGPPIKDPQAARHQTRLIHRLAVPSPVASTPAASAAHDGRLAVPSPVASTPAASAAHDGLQPSQRRAERQRHHDGATRRPSNRSR